MEASEFLLFGFCSSFFSPPTQTSDADETYEYCTSTCKKSRDESDDE